MLTITARSFTIVTYLLDRSMPKRTSLWNSGKISGRWTVSVSTKSHALAHAHDRAVHIYLSEMRQTSIVILSSTPPTKPKAADPVVPDDEIQEGQAQRRVPNYTWMTTASGCFVPLRGILTDLSAGLCQLFSVVHLSYTITLFHN